MIQTHTISLEKSKFLKILLLRYLKTRWPLYGSVFLLAIFISQKSTPDSMDKFFLILCLLYPLMIVFQYWRWVNAKDNQIFLVDRSYDIDGDKITGRTDANNFSIVEKSNFIKTDTLLNTYLLYVSKSQFFYFPFDSFKTEEDRLWFEGNYVKRVKK